MSDEQKNSFRPDSRSQTKQVLPPHQPPKQEEKIIYPSNRKQLDQARKNYLSVIYLNDHVDLKPLPPSDLKVEDLAKSILLGILSEIKSRRGSNSSNGETSSKVKPILTYDLNPDLGDKDEDLIRYELQPSGVSSKPQQPLKYVTDKNQSLNIKNFEPNDFINSRFPSRQINQDKSGNLPGKKIAPVTDAPKLDKNMQFAPLLSNYKVFDPAESVIEYKKPSKANKPEKRDTELSKDELEDGFATKPEKIELKRFETNKPTPKPTKVIKSEKIESITPEKKEKIDSELSQKTSHKPDKKELYKKPLITESKSLKEVNKVKQANSDELKHPYRLSLDTNKGNITIVKQSKQKKVPLKAKTEAVSVEVKDKTTDTKYDGSLEIDANEEEEQEGDNSVMDITIRMVNQSSPDYELEDKSDDDYNIGDNDGEGENEEELDELVSEVIDNLLKKLGEHKEVDISKNIEDAEKFEENIDIGNLENYGSEDECLDKKETDRADDDFPKTSLKTEEELNDTNKIALDKDELKKETHDDPKKDSGEKDIKLETKTRPKSKTDNDTKLIEDKIQTAPELDVDLVMDTDDGKDYGDDDGEDDDNESSKDKIQEKHESDINVEKEFLENQISSNVKEDKGNEVEKPANKTSKKKKIKEPKISKPISPILFGVRQSNDDGPSETDSDDIDEDEDEDEREMSFTSKQQSERDKTELSIILITDEEEVKQDDESKDNKPVEFKPLLEPTLDDNLDEEKVEIPSELLKESDEPQIEENVVPDEEPDKAVLDEEKYEGGQVKGSIEIKEDEIVDDSGAKEEPKENEIQISLPKKRKEKKLVEMDDGHFYDYDALVFKPVISEESNLNQDLLKLYHSFGYDCNKRSNLHLIDSETLMFSAGNLVVMLNIKTKQQKYLKTLSGGAVGAITVHPSLKYFAVGEKGNVPNINIYEYPSLKLHRILRQGTLRGYAFLDFDPTGKLLASLGSAPDYMLTIWDWKQEKIVLRTKAFSQDVFKVTFSKDLAGILTSAGSGHIKFWKMASTFTGFKLQGDIGKFGKTEISDIEGYAELPDGKVLSGTEWGNMLLWDGGLIQTEICRKKNKPCHVGSIQQITLNESDVYTIGDDGWVRVWDFETIDTSEPSEEGVKLEIEPINELKVGTNVSLRTMVKDLAEDSTIWYAQDSKGGIWKLDLSFSASSESPKQLFTFHSGVINGIETCPIGHLFATTADDGSLRVYNYTNYEILAQRKFNTSGTCLKWMPTGVDPEGGTIAAGFNDGVLRFLKLVPKNDNHFDLVLMEAFKPHTKAIRSIAIDSKNAIIATGSDDQTIFFFSNKKNVRTPIGFINLPSPITYMAWTPPEYEKSRLLVCMQNGSVWEFDASVEGKYDTTKSYLIELNLKSRKYTFKSIKSRLRHEEELERQRIEEEARKKKEDEERRLRGIDEEEENKKKKGKKSLDKKKEKEKEKVEEEVTIDKDNANNEDGRKKEEATPEEQNQAAPAVDEWNPYIPEIPSKIHWATYSSPDSFWLSMDDYDAGYLYECKFIDDVQKSKISPDKVDEPFRAVPIVKSDLTNSEDIPLTSMIFNNKKTYCIIGEKNGVIRINPVPENKQIEEIKHYWSYGYHDNDYGRITKICLSYDEKFLFSVGADSNIFGILFNSTFDDLEKAKTEKIRLTCQNQIRDVTDVDDPNAYSIEQAKQKSESDKTLAIAEGKKQEMRQKINELRRTFKDLSSKNDQLVPRLRLDKNEFQIEDSIKQHVFKQVGDRINLTYRELAWQSEKCHLLLEKLQKRFKDVIECDHIVVHTFDNTLYVNSFRTVTLPKDMEQYKSELEKQYLAKLLEKQKNKENIENQGSESGANEELQLPGMSALDQMRKIFGKLRGNTAAKVERALKKMEEKKMKRLKRKKEWKELNDSRLPDDYENPEDLASIKFAEDNLGDFKLKSSDNYIVPENQRMNVYKAVERLMQIKEFIHKNQMLFNEKLLKLRDKKKSLVGEINDSIDRLEQINFLLGQPVVENKLSKFYLRPEEIPEKKYEYTKEKLIEFKKEIESKSYHQKAHEDEHSSGGLGGFSSGASQSQSVMKKTDNATTETKSILDGLKPIWQSKETMSPLMRQTVQAKEIRLMFEQKQLYKNIEEKIMLFDAELKVLRHDRARIAIFLKNADLRHVTIYEEFMLLRDFEKTENELELKLNKKKEEHLDMQTKLTEVQLKIDNKRKDLEKLDENYKQLGNSLTQMIHEETKYHDFLTKVYKRKIKRKKKIEGQEEDEESEEESEESDSDDEDFNEEDEDSDGEGKEQLDLDICPSGLRQELFDQVCQLREKRLDLDELIAEEKRTLEQFKKDQDALIKKGKIVENSLKQAQQELENFQKEKQKKINNLDIVVTLRLNQIQFLEKGKLPADLSKALAFDSKDLDRLENRIKELQIEKHTEKKLFKTLRERHTNLIRDKKKMDEYVERLDELCNKMMSDKFGKLIDIEKLELIAVNQQIEELKQRLAENEFDHEKVMQEWLSKINNEKDEAIDLIKANTSRINEMIDIIGQTKRVENKLDTKQSSLGEELAGTSQKDIDERQRLHTLVQLQAQEIEALKAEISILSRKGGHILPPTQPPSLSQIQT